MASAWADRRRKLAAAGRGVARHAVARSGEVLAAVDDRVVGFPRAAACCLGQVGGRVTSHSDDSQDDSRSTARAMRVRVRVRVSIDLQRWVPQANGMRTRLEDSGDESPGGSCRDRYAAVAAMSASVRRVAMRFMQSGSAA